uniref:Uncharacterized protein n=1 Tax=Candidatus Kentrum sp. LPFa TaxID=2126335 RepID=A0A450WPR6_9GAMM|nr:MAG: hypothetical protein BECKLPF1236B_GA0070989_11583 [Candidatus Kentron sp. LPFa]
MVYWNIHVFLKCMKSSEALLRTDEACGSVLVKWNLRFVKLWFVCEADREIN